MSSDFGTKPPGSGLAPAAPEVPAAFAKEGAPYSLDELLSGLPPVAGDDALLLSELAPKPSVPPTGWMTAPAASDAPAPTSPTEELRQADPGAAVEVVADAAETPLPVEPSDDDLLEPDADDVLELTEEMAEAPSVDEWDPATLSEGNLVAALNALAEEAGGGQEDEDAPVREEEAPGPDTQAVDELQPATADEATTTLADDGAGDAAAILAAQVEAILAAHLPEGFAAKGDTALPDRLDALEILLADPPPTDDFAALDALYACWPRGTQDSPSRVLLAAALNLSRYFGLPGRLPMTAAKAWRMLSPSLFEAELAQRLAGIGAFIAQWQATQRTFLILEFGEVELIEYLFEALHPGYHAELLAGVMNFKVLSNRRMGLLRRIPTRLKKQVSGLLPERKEEALVELAHAKALLEQVAGNGFAPIAEAAGKALEEIEKMMKASANAGAPPPAALPGGGLPLGRMG